MCSVHTPKAPETKEKPLQYLTNVWLDGTGASQGVIGRNSLRMDLGGPAQRVPVNTQATPAAAPAATPAASTGAQTVTTGTTGGRIGMGTTTQRVNTPWQAL